MSGISQGGDIASQAEKRCRDGEAAAPGLEGDWQVPPPCLLALVAL